MIVPCDAMLSVLIRFNFHRDWTLRLRIRSRGPFPAIPHLKSIPPACWTCYFLRLASRSRRPAVIFIMACINGTDGTDDS